ncbi:AraC family transcriptional regulator [Flavobacterium sp. CS20]|jgi:YesN/AraC family two-component response regulator|uniref:helix-turn-helix domain-containing protein n=1 Tax=Flavobacterium sp. CS20 TaxID=2775246 RepID=UPI001B3A2A78|nr:helix-turn-helix domain-containing protein [Flavobacterium sp. CS20]QTY27200.1 AraC family transcriptional regulator [Flavobacterium sp. CS20]
MSFIKILTEKDFLKNAKEGYLLRPSGNSVIFLVEGTIEMEINGKPVSFDDEHIILISKKNIYKLVRFTKTLEMYVLIHNREVTREKVQFNFSRYDVYQIINAEKNQNIFKLENTVFHQTVGLVKLLNYYTNHDIKFSSQEQIIIALFTAIIHILMDSLVEKLQSETKINTRKEEIVLRFIELVSIHFKTKKRLGFYAEKLHISIKYLSICVKEITHRPPTEFIANALTNEAKTLLLSTKKTISDISSELSFSDQYAFGKFFKKHTGLSPKNYRIKNGTIFIDTI